MGKFFALFVEAFTDLAAEVFWDVVPVEKGDFSELFHFEFWKEYKGGEGKMYLDDLLPVDL